MPLLTILVCTYNRSRFLQVMLEALLPQAAKFEEEVEVWIVDNGSPDNTPAVIRNSHRLGPFKYHRHETNIGPLESGLFGILNLAQGTYLWCLGDHNLLRPDALHNVVQSLRRHPNLDAFYVNFRCATYPDQWPSSALGGYDGEYDYLANESTSADPVPHWSDLISTSHTSAFCTQIYAHIIRRKVWRNFWQGRSFPKSHTRGISTYAHTWMLSSVLFNEPAGRIPEAALTIFNGAQSWGDPSTRAQVYMRGFPELIDLFIKQGLPDEKVSAARKFNFQQAQDAMSEFFLRPGVKPWREFLFYMRITTSHKYLWAALVAAFVESRFHRTSHAFKQCSTHFNRTRLYLYRHNRFSRWWHRRSSLRSHKEERSDS